MHTTAEIREELRAKESTLLARLRRADAKMAPLLDAGQPVPGQWETLYCELLAEYTAVFDKRAGLEVKE